MRLNTVLVIAGVAVTQFPAALLAQKDFEGTITWGSLLATGGAGQTVISVKNGKTRVDMTGKKPGESLTSIRDGSGRILMLIVPRKAYYVMGNARELLDAYKYEPTGRKETVAGYPCEYYRVTGANGSSKSDTEECITTALGFAAVAQGGAMADAQAKAIRQQFPNGFMILKVSRAGKSPVEVLKVERKSLGDNLFAPPPDYTEVKMGRSDN